MDDSKEAKIDQVFSLYRQYGNANYIGEPVSQLEHASQCAMLAQTDGFSNEVILGAFLHDIGHLLGEVKYTEENMISDGITLGIKQHEQKGAQYLEKIGLPDVIVEIAKGHVNAKRYLCFKNKEYYNKLSAASKMTLEHQGGPMDSTEATSFEKNPYFEVIIKARRWDEAAKMENCEIKPLNYYKDMMRQCLP